MNNAIFVKTTENIKNHRGIKLITTKARRNYLVSEPNYRAINFFSENLLVIKLRRTQMLMNKPICLGLSIQVYQYFFNECLYDHVKPKS